MNSAAAKFQEKFNYFRKAMLCLVNRARARESIPQTNIFFLITSGVCNLACRFCHYPKKTAGKEITARASFAAYLEQVGATGITHISLTPMTGEALFDKGFLEKVEIIERSPTIRSFELFSNFILARPAIIDRLADSAKFKALTISLYGHEAESFTRITQKPAIQFDRLVANLEYLATMQERWPANTTFGMRHSRHFAWSPLAAATEPESRLQSVLRTLCQHPRFFWAGNYTNYDSWAGTVSDEDVRGLDVEIRQHAAMPKIGACYAIFDEQAILPDGRVNACACRAIDDSLIIGDLNQSSLKDILSLRNPAFRDLIDGQQRGDFPSACRKCTWYRSIYYRKTRGDNPEYITMREFRKRHGLKPA